MIDSIKYDVTGHVTIKDKGTGEVLLDKFNKIHYGNFSTKIAEAFIGKPDAFITYMAFGNGGLTIDSSGIITYNEPNTSNSKVPAAQLYNTVYIKEIENYNSDTFSEATVDTIAGGGINNYEDITITVTLSNDEPDGQLLIDNSNSVNENPLSNTDFVFNEIALYSGVKNQGNKQTEAEIEGFINGGDPGSRPLMLTHVVFHPIQKSQNREIEVIYRLRIQMGI